MLELNFICILAVASLISLIHLDATDALPLQENPTALHIQDVRRRSDDIQALPSDHNLSLFQKKSALDNTQKKVNVPQVHPGLRTKSLQMVAQDIEEGGGEMPKPERREDGDAEAEAEADPDTDSGTGSDTDSDTGADTGSETGSNGKAPGNGTDSGGPKEITISVPKFQKDHMGNWIYHQWGATFGNVWGDTRFNNGRFTIPRITVDPSAPNNYYPDGPRSTVCLGSTIYNVPRVKNWLKRNVYREEHKHRPFWDDLRQKIFTQGNSEECHDAVKYANWKEYQKCALRRNQRLEYMVPKYPSHQIGYRGTHTMSSPHH
ncbi:uncharacterized protein LOC117780625 [Drosophila innubila]|uniref:uncharacterized protein LOC117780625 n=1 Tax=Drosophila innubila TaxID=198719 RepID=UPI00148D5BCA|nr:uncharacterized protein LOC117780625 [Drosophila innubila]